jgi:hypothetical protein
MGVNIVIICQIDVVNLIDPKAWKSRPPGNGRPFIIYQELHANLKWRSIICTGTLYSLFLKNIFPPTIENPTHFERGE